MIKKIFKIYSIYSLTSWTLYGIASSLLEDAEAGYLNPNISYEEKKKNYKMGPVCVGAWNKFKKVFKIIIEQA